MSHDQRVVVVVVSYNGGSELVACLRSLLDQTLEDLDIVVVDNASSDDSIERVESLFGDAIRVIRRPTDDGYATGANAGWRATTAPIVTIVTHDLTFAPDCLAQMRQVLLEEPRDALVTPKIVLKSDPSRVNAVGNDIHVSGVAWCHGLGTPVDDWHGVVEVTGISGAAIMTSRTLLERLGGMEESYIMYMEDVDLSLRTRLLGGVCLAACDAVATHDYTVSFSPGKFGVLERNRRIMWKRLFGNEGWRLKMVLLQAEAVGWVYAFKRGRKHVMAKARGLDARPLSTRVEAGREARRSLGSLLATGLPYDIVLPGATAIASLGRLVDGIVVRIAGIPRRP